GEDALPAQAPPGPGRYYYFGGGFTLTRLHTRYDKQALGADLVLRSAPAIVGGREMYGVRKGESEPGIEHGALPSSYNNFQARYAIRHPWTGAIACDHPRRGMWGGPPAGHAYEQPTAATKIAFAKRGAELASFVTADVPEIDFLRAAPKPAASASSAAGAPPPPQGC